MLTLAFVLVNLFSCNDKDKKEELTKPNFLMLMSDNHYFSHLSCYGDPVVKTPTIDQLAKQGVRFTNAYCGSPSCTPARGALLAGQDIWRLGEAGNLWSRLDSSIPTYVDLLEESGYHVGHDRKGWGPGDYKAGGRNRNPAGYTFKDYEHFMDENVEKKPWSFWLSSRNPHRPFEHGAGIASGLDPSKVVVPPYLPDTKEVRSDICDYYYQIQQFDIEVAQAINILKESGQYNNTVIIMCGDNGWMMPRGLANLYDFGVKVPLIITYQKEFMAERIIDDFVSLNDLAPTIVELAGLDVPDEMNAISLNPILNSDQSGKIDAKRDFIVTARERHAMCRKDGLGYPGRAIRTDGFLFIHNIEPERWPAGDPPLFGDIDLHMLQDKSPTKEYMMEHKTEPEIKDIYALAFLKRPMYELFDLRTDPFQMNNVAEDSEYKTELENLKSKLKTHLVEMKDPRALGLTAEWDIFPYYKEADWIGKPRKEAQELFGLDEQYPYR